MCLVNNHKIKFFWPIVIVASFNDFVQAAVCNELSILSESKVFKSVTPVLFYSRRIYDENFSILAVFLNKSFGNHSSNDGLSCTNDIGKEKAIILL